MRFKLDENLPRAARAVLAAPGWDVHDVHEEGLAATLDTDYADVRLVDPVTSPGVLLLRPLDQSIKATVSCLEGAVRLLATESPSGALDAAPVRNDRLLSVLFTDCDSNMKKTSPAVAADGGAR